MSYGRPPPRIDGMVSLKVDNLTFRTTPEDLRRAFERCGEVGDIYIPRDRFTRESRGFAFVRFYDKRDAEDALDAMDGKMLDGRELRVQMARYGRPSSPHRRRHRGGGGGGGGGRRRYSRSRSRGSRHRSRSRSRRAARSDSRSSRSRSNSKSSRERSPATPTLNNRRKSKSDATSRSRSKSS